MSFKQRLVDFINSPEAQLILRGRYQASIEDSLIGLVAVGVTLMIALAILGALTPTLTSLTQNTTFADTATSVVTNLGSAFNVAAIIPLVAVATLIILLIRGIR